MSRTLHKLFVLAMILSIVIAIPVFAQQPAVPVERSTLAVKAGPTYVVPRTLRPVETQAPALAPSQAVTLTLLHNNDSESQLVDAGSGLEDFGGVARFATVVTQVRSAVGGSHPLLLVTSGDNFLAGPEWTASLDKGVPFYDSIAMDRIGYDAMALGNHDFDFGPDTLADFIEGFTTSQVPFLSANLVFTAEARLQTLVDTGRIARSIVITAGGEQFGIVGATTPNLVFISSPRNVVVGQDVQAAVQAEIDALEAAGVNKIILISHLQGIDEDLALAPLLSGVDVIIAGGGDEILANPSDLLVPGDSIYGPYPIEVQNADGITIPVVTTAGEYKYLGRLDVVFDASGNVISYSGGPIRVAGGTQTDAVVPDPIVQTQVVTPVKAFVANLAANVIATSTVALDGRRNSVRSVETNEGNLIADAFLWKATQVYTDYGAPAPDVAMSNGGGIRNNSVITAGDITELDTFDMLPFLNFLTTVPDVTPADFLALVENAVSRLDADGNPTGDGTGRFAQIAGFSFTFVPHLTPGNRVLSATLDDGTVMIQNGEIAPTARDVNVAIVDFLARGGDEYFGGPPGRSEFFILGTSYQQALADYIQAPTATGGLSGTISAAQYPEGGEGRIVRGVAPNLSIVKAVTPTTDVALPSVVTYTIVISNSGDADAAGVVMTDTLPSEVTFGGWVQQGSASLLFPPAGATIVWGPWSIPAGMDYTFNFTATVTTSTTYYGAEVTNTVEFDSDNAGSGSNDAIFTIEDVPVAAFSATPLTGTVPLTVTFTDESTNSPTSWLWDFGDTMTGTLQDPTHTYTNAGVYTVTLTAGNAVGSDSEVKPSYITVEEAGYEIYLPLVMRNY
ncbi:MAG: 5'-nucleotidase C-terminal domain-containing protein [Anaerolineae bacterium]